MSETEDSDASAQQSNQPPTAALNSDPADAAYRKKTTYDPYGEAKKFIGKRVSYWLNSVVGWLDAHNGLVTAVATAVIAWLTWSIASDSKQQAETANGTLEAIRGQLRAMEREERPWIAIEGAPTLVASPVVNDEKWATVNMVLHIRNVGKTPAVRVTSRSRLVASDEGQSQVLDHQRKICPSVPGKVSLKKDEHFIENTVMPNGDTHYMTVADSTTNRKLPEVAGGLIEADFVVVGCMIYQFVESDDNFHSTGFIYRVGRRDKKPLYLPVGAVAKIEDLVVDAVMEGSGPAN